MDLKGFVDYFSPATCILSVEKKAGGGCGTIRINTGNGKYIDALALAAGGVEMDSEKKEEFIPNSEYTRYIPKDLNFEDVCYRCAVLKEPIHNCLRASRYPFDILVYMMPLESQDESIGYCTFSQVLIPKSDNNLMSLNISQQTATEVINTCIRLRDDDFFDLAMTWQDTMAGSYCLVIRDANDMEFIRLKNPKWYLSMQNARVERLVLFPLIPRGQFLGYIMAINFDVQNTQHIKDTLELTTFFIASEIANNRFIDQLKALNAVDLLTGAMNRNALNERLQELEGAPAGTDCHMGIVFADMNGLKYVNDNLGHAAGDILLKNAAMILQSTFVDAEIYRVGGDEFLVLVHETDETDLRQKIADIKKKAELFENVSFAAGYCQLDQPCDIRKAMAAADANMYEDKENCYRISPDLRRR